MGKIYQDDDGRFITTNSMIKSFHRCPKQFQYKYIQRLKPRVYSKPLERGTWIHTLLEFYYTGRDWKAEHRRLSANFNELFDEEREALGDLPDECYRLMQSYLWHYGANKADPLHGWEVLEAEYTIEAEFPDGDTYRGRTDLLIRDEYGVWIVDHKSHKRLPDLNFRLLDMQSAMYLWALRQQGVDVQGFIWNYLRTVAPTKPELLKDGTRLSRRKIDTDYPTMVKAIQEYGLNPSDYADQLNYLKSTRWRHGEIQTSTFFRREVLYKDDALLDHVAAEAFRAKKRMEAYGFERADVERVPDRSCQFSCSYLNLCTAELFGSGEHLRRKDFIADSDPLAYYDPRADTH